MPKPIGTPGGGKNKKPEILDQTFSIDENSVKAFRSNAESLGIPKGLVL